MSVGDKTIKLVIDGLTHLGVSFSAVQSGAKFSVLFPFSETLKIVKIVQKWNTTPFAGDHEKKTKLVLLPVQMLELRVEDPRLKIRIQREEFRAFARWLRTLSKEDLVEKWKRR